MFSFSEEEKEQVPKAQQHKHKAAATFGGHSSVASSGLGFGSCAGVASTKLRRLGGFKGWVAEAAVHS